MEWQPIETAPKDGTRVLLFNPVAGVWSSEYHYDSESFPLLIWRGKLGTWFPEPSHWMPLPKLPEGV